MLYPRNGKVVIIDDVLEEALPLMQSLRSKNVSTLYYSGRYDELPAEPLNDVRLVFCDLKFNPAEDSKSVIANIHALLNKIKPKISSKYSIKTLLFKQKDFYTYV